MVSTTGPENQTNPPEKGETNNDFFEDYGKIAGMFLYNNVILAGLKWS